MVNVLQCFLISNLVSKMACLPAWLTNCFAGVCGKTKPQPQKPLSEAEREYYENVGRH